MPWTRKTLSAYRICAQLVMTPQAWSDTDRLLVTMTTRTLRDVTQTIPSNVGYDAIWDQPAITTPTIPTME